MVGILKCGVLLPMKEVELRSLRRRGVLIGEGQVGRPSGSKNSQAAVEKRLHSNSDFTASHQVIVSNSQITWCLSFLICEMETGVGPVFRGCSEDWVKMSKYLEYLVQSEASINVRYCCCDGRRELAFNMKQQRKEEWEGWGPVLEGLQCPISLDLIKALKAQCGFLNGGRQG